MTTSFKLTFVFAGTLKSAARLQAWNPDWGTTTLVWSLEMTWKKRTSACKIMMMMMMEKDIATFCTLINHLITFFSPPSKVSFLPSWMSRSVWATSENSSATTRSTRAFRLSWTTSTWAWPTWTKSWTDTLRGALSSWWVWWDGNWKGQRQFVFSSEIFAATEETRCVNIDENVWKIGQNFTIYKDLNWLNLGEGW